MTWIFLVISLILFFTYIILDAPEMDDNGNIVKQSKLKRWIKK